ncbi:zinc finger BED domain-containing protein 4-like [Hydra vulgaris]|uniref:zinc finger BED domain-containing protein 4-like n=1 Tax=Hydra vulgaris TaxID=6087 RepID=UPI001F5F1307|nr:zinc finger BED domain-containing protein 4-like [Hydra vulgaris]
MSVEDSFTSKKIWDINDEKSKRIHRKIAILIALDNQPFSLTKDDGFIAIPQLYDQIKKKVLNEIAKSQCISFTSDIWTIGLHIGLTSHETFISLSEHWMKKNFDRKGAVLYASYFLEARTGINIARKFINMLENWKIMGNKCTRRHTLVKDGAANMSLGSKLIQITSVHCTIHLLQLVIKNAVLSQILVIDLLTKARRIVGHFYHSSKVCTEFKLLQQQNENTPLLLVQDVPTRWNSAYLMLERLQKLKRAVQMYLADHNELPTFASNDWKIIENLLYVISLFMNLLML